MKNSLRIFTFLFIAFLPVSSAFSAIWDGGGSDNSASTRENWTEDSLPLLGDIIIFDGTSSKDCTWDLNESYNYLIMDGANTGAVTLNSTLTLQTPVCDSGLAMDSNDPLEAAKALGICLGLQSAEWVLPDGSSIAGIPSFDIGHGILTGFGSNVTPRQGAAMLALSSGTARDPGDTGYGGVDSIKGYSHALPAGFPAAVNGCETPGSGHDGIALKVTLAVPSWANAYQFRWKYYTSDYPSYICTTYVDNAIMRSVPAPAGALNGNVMFDALGNPVSANSPGSLGVCSYVDPPGYSCPYGTAELQGTGFESNGASPWMTTTVPATGGTTLTLYFTIWDSGDNWGNSTILFDAWEWLPST